MEGAAPQNASGSRKKPRVDRRRKYPALKDQQTCVFELPPLIEEQVLNSTPFQTVPGPSRALIPCPSRALIPCPSRALIPCPSPIRTVPGPSLALTLGSSRAQAVQGPRHPVHTSSDQSTELVVGQVVEGVIDGKFEDGYLISVNVGGITMKGVAYGLVTDEPDPAPEGQTVQQNNNGVQEPQRHYGKHISSQLVPGTLRKIQPWSRIGNSGGGTSSKSTKHKYKDQARDGRGRGKGKM